MLKRICTLEGIGQGRIYSLKSTASSAVFGPDLHFGRSIAGTWCLWTLDGNWRYQYLRYVTVAELRKLRCHRFLSDAELKEINQAKAVAGAKAQAEVYRLAREAAASR